MACRCERAHGSLPHGLPGRPTGKLIEFAKALYKPGRSAAELAVWGLKPEDFADDAFEVWDESALSANAFTWVMTQWRPGFNGPTGLDYTAAMAALRARFPGTYQRS